MLFMVIEQFRDGRARPVYERFRERGRLAPEGVDYVNSWVTADLTQCYQVMRIDDRALLDQWITAWSDLVDFELIPVKYATVFMSKLQILRTCRGRRRIGSFQSAPTRASVRSCLTDVLRIRLRMLLTAVFAELRRSCTTQPKRCKQMARSTSLVLGYFACLSGIPR